MTKGSKTVNGGAINPILTINLSFRKNLLHTRSNCLNRFMLL